MSIEDVLSSLPLEIIQGKYVVEVRPRAVSKAKVLNKIILDRSFTKHKGEVDFIFCVGDDRSDEDMFTCLKQNQDSVTKNIFTVHIGTDASQAQTFVESTYELRRVLRAFASVSKKDSDLRDLGVDELPRA